MKTFLLSLSLMIAFTSFAQETIVSPKRNNFFLSTELSKTLGTSSFDKKYGISFVYNRLLSNSRFGIGVGIEQLDIRTKQLGGTMPSLDVRYYATIGKSTLIPMAQLGYNFYRFQYSKLPTGLAYEEKGGLGYSFGLGYSYNLTPKGGGLYGAFRFRQLQYNYNDPSLPKRAASERLSLSLGWRF